MKQQSNCYKYHATTMVLGVQCGTRKGALENYWLLGLLGHTGGYMGVLGNIFVFSKYLLEKNRSFSKITIVFTKFTIFPFSERSISNSFFWKILFSMKNFDYSQKFQSFKKTMPISTPSTFFNLLNEIKTNIFFE